MDIIINKADKGGAVVVQNTSDFIKQSKKEIADPIFHELMTIDKTDRSDPNGEIQGSPNILSTQDT